MGYTLHEAIIVTWPFESQAEATHAKAVALGLTVSGIVAAPLNGFRSFAVLPDGSKEGWHDADEHERKRAELVEFMRRDPSVTYSDGSSAVDFCRVQWGEETNAVARSRREIVRADASPVLPFDAETRT